MSFMVRFLNIQRLWQLKGKASCLPLMFLSVPTTAAFTAEAAVPCRCSEAPGEHSAIRWKTGHRTRTSRKSEAWLNWIKSKRKIQISGSKNLRQSLFSGPRKDTLAASEFQERKIASVFSQLLFNIKQFRYLRKRYIASNYKSSFYISLSLKESHSRGNSVKR